MRATDSYTFAISHQGTRQLWQNLTSCQRTIRVRTFTPGTRHAVGEYLSLRSHGNSIPHPTALRTFQDPRISADRMSGLTRSRGCPSGPRAGELPIRRGAWRAGAHAGRAHLSGAGDAAGGGGGGLHPRRGGSGMSQSLLK